MVRLFTLVLISFCFTALSIYANCDLPTGGACSIEDLKQKQQEQKYQKSLSLDKLMEEMQQDAKLEEEKRIQKDLNNQVHLEKLYNLEFED